MYTCSVRYKYRLNLWRDGLRTKILNFFPHNCICLPAFLLWDYECPAGDPQRHLFSRVWMEAVQGWQVAKVSGYGKGYTHKNLNSMLSSLIHLRIVSRDIAL